MEKNLITHSEGASSFTGRAAVDVFACIVTASGIKLYLNSQKRIKPCRGWTEKVALEFVRVRTGMTFKKSQLLEAAQFLLMWAHAKRANIEEISTRPVDIGHCYTVARWGCDDKAAVQEIIDTLKLRGSLLLEEIDRRAIKYDLADPINDRTIDPANIDARKQAVANIREMVAGLEAGRG